MIDIYYLILYSKVSFSDFLYSDYVINKTYFNEISHLVGEATMTLTLDKVN
jgi:hypothetical protein